MSFYFSFQFLGKAESRKVPNQANKANGRKISTSSYCLPLIKSKWTTPLWSKKQISILIYDRIIRVLLVLVNLYVIFLKFCWQISYVTYSRDTLAISQTLSSGAIGPRKRTPRAVIFDAGNESEARCNEDLIIKKKLISIPSEPSDFLVFTRKKQRDEQQESIYAGSDCKNLLHGYSTLMSFFRELEYIFKMFQDK